ncbi:hypothetical protein BVX97_04920 [bacterium E08(2017)]|nr:hypothetical protein BVX97_04920 [bacterium E08(2017)]
MYSALKKSKAIEKRRKKIDKELALLNNDIKSLEKTVQHPFSGSRPKLKSEGKKSPSEPRENDSVSRVGKKDDRLGEYLSGNIHDVGSMKNERRLQRNKAITMIIVVIIVALLIWRRFL